MRTENWNRHNVTLAHACVYPHLHDRSRMIAQVGILQYNNIHFLHSDQSYGPGQLYYKFMGEPKPMIIYPDNTTVQKGSKQDSLYSLLWKDEIGTFTHIMHMV